MAIPGPLAIEHMEGTSPAEFKLTRLPDGKSALFVRLTSFRLKASPTSI